MVFKTIDSSLPCGMSSLGRQSGQGRSLTGQKSGTAGCPGLQPGSVGLGHRRPRSFSSYRSRLLRFLLCSKGKGKGHRSSGRRCLPSELLQATVHLSFALFPCPGPALGTEFLQVFFKVFMVHWSVTGGLTVRLQGRENKRTRSGHAHLTQPGFPLPRAASLEEARGRASEFHGSLVLSGCLSRHQTLANSSSYKPTGPAWAHGDMLSTDPSPDISGKTPCILPSGHTVQGSGVWGIHCQVDLFLSHIGTCEKE